jgi:LysM repeat protein
MPPRSPFRVLPPLALVLVVLAVWFVVSPQDDPGSGRVATGGTTTATPAQPERRTYTVRTGDSLSRVAQRYGLTVERLIELNPRVDPQTLTRGQRLRLRD